MINDNGNESKTIYEAYLLEKVESTSLINKRLTEALDKAKDKLEAAVTATNSISNAVLTEEALLIIKDAKLELQND